ncbi:hypothetical protein KAR10_09500 [bacterium]|nr:hypothetical protein [bacterium]
MALAMARGTTSVAYTPIYMGSGFTDTGFTMKVPDTNLYYDILLCAGMESDSVPLVVGRAYDCVTDTANTNIIIEPNGNSVYGSVAHSSGHSLMQLIRNQVFFTITREIGGIERFYDMAMPMSGYSTAPYMDHLGTYVIGITGSAIYLLDEYASRSMMGDNARVDFSFNTDPAQDPAGVSIYNLEPVPQSVVPDLRPVIKVKLWDDFLGSGVDSGSINVSLDGSVVSHQISMGPENEYTVSFQPSSDLSPGSNPHVVIISADDQSTTSPPLPPAVVSWEFDVPTYTPTSTLTQTPTQTPVYSPTNTPSITPTATISMTATNSVTYTITPTVTPSPTNSPTGTSTSTSTVTLTFTSSPTVTATSTITPTSTITSTYTVSPTRSATATITPTSTPRTFTESVVDRNWFNPDQGGVLNLHLGQIPEGEQLTIKVYNSVGSLVKTLVSNQDRPEVISWDGKNTGGQTVASGVYYIRVESSSMHKTFRIAIIR